MSLSTLLAVALMLGTTLFSMVVFAIIGEGSKALVLHKPLAWGDTVKAGLQLGLIVDGLLVLIIGVIVGAGPGVRWLARTSSGNHTLLTVLAVSVGVVLFALRKRYRIFYGMLEVSASVGGMVVYPTAPPIPSEGLSTPTVAWGLGLLSLMYILVRGLDNIDVGRVARFRISPEAAL